MGKKKSSAKIYRFGKIFEVETRWFHKPINFTYNMFMIVKDFTGKLLWFGSCFAFMFLFPMTFEIFCEQQRILTKIQMSQMMEMAQEPQGAPPVVRPF